MYAQQFGTGAQIDSAKYQEVPLVTPVTTKSYEQVPYRYSLRPYCPAPGDQYDTGTCVGWAAAYGARTIIHALNNGWNNVEHKTLINTHAFSPSFVYSEVLKSEGREKDCSIGAHIADALHIMHTTGSVKYADFPFDPFCENSVDDNLLQKAQNYRIKGFQRLTFSDDDNTKVNKVRQSIANKLPVILGIKILDNFKDTHHENNIWNPRLGDPKESNIHAMLVVGYDDEEQTFELMNSWGTEWSDEGFIKIAYRDFNYYAKEAYHILYDKKPVADNTPASTVVNMAAHINFAELAMEADRNSKELNCTAEHIGNMDADFNEGYYKMSNTHISQSGYQIYLTPEMQNMNVYAFSFNPDNSTKLLYPYSEETLMLHGGNNSNQFITSIIPYLGSTIAIPHEDYCMQLDNNTGTINCFLFSKRELDITAILKNLAKLDGNLQSRLKAVLGQKMAPNNKVTYDDYRIGFEAQVKADKVVPLIVDMNHTR